MDDLGTRAPELRDPHSLPELGSLPGGIGGWALFLDFDGTLVEIAARPEEVIVPPELISTLAELFIQLHGAVAIVTGRKLEDVDAMLGPIGLPVAAMHGAAVRMAGKTATASGAEPVPEAISTALHAFVLAHPGLLLEPKGESLAVHYRNVPDLCRLVESTVSELVAAHAPQHDLQPGKMVFEIKPRGVNKGRAIEALLGTPSFAGRRPAVFGDDLTDEAGFATARAHGGSATLIGLPDRGTAATSRLANPAALRHWLTQLSRATD